MITIEKLLSRKIFGDIDISKVTECQKTEISKILEVYDNVRIKNRMKNIHDFIKFNVDGDWLERLNIIINVLKNDIASEYALEIRYGKENVELVKSELYVKFAHTLDGYIKKYGKEDGVNKYTEYLVNSKTPWGFEACIERYGETEGTKKWQERLTKKIETQKERRKIKPYRNGRTLVEYQDRDGVKVGYQKWIKRNNQQKYRFSEKYFIDLYGDKHGKVKWLEYCTTMSKTSLQSFIDRYGCKVGKIKFIEFLDKQFRSGVYYSKISQELFWLLFNKLTDIDKINVKFAELNGEEYFYVNIKNIFTILVDFKCGDKIIEFDGDYWHSKPEQKSKDMVRDEFLIGKGYKILRIKESEYKINKEKTLEKCLNFLK